jgi:hypothetical protein
LPEPALACGTQPGQEKDAMLVFIDTEFTDFKRTDLISIALVADDGREFYAERIDYIQEYCNEFVRQEVLPLLGRVPGARCMRAELTYRLREWFDALPEPAVLVFDYFTDWHLLVDALLGDNLDTPPANVGTKLLLGGEIVGDPVFQRASNWTFSRKWPRHHALADARALMAGYKAWQEEEGGNFD